MPGWRSGQCKVKMAVLSRFPYCWTESDMIHWIAAMEIYSNSHSSNPIPILLFLLPFPFPWYSHCQPHLKGIPWDLWDPNWTELNWIVPIPIPMHISSNIPTEGCRFEWPKLLNGTNFNDLEWPLTHISRSRLLFNVK